MLRFRQPYAPEPALSVPTQGRPRPPASSL